MNVNNIKTGINYLAKSTKTSDFVSSLGKTGAILPVVLLEATVTGGRTYQANQRDGIVEARERLTEESLGAVFWLFGATMFGKLFDTIGKKVFKLPQEHYDVGHDAVRKPLNNIVLEHAGDPKYKKGLLTNSKLGKIVASLVAACAFIGFVVPKMNQAITKKFFANKITPEKKLDPRMEKMYEHLHRKDIGINAVQNFKRTTAESAGLGERQDHNSFNARTKSLPQAAKPISFKSAEFVARMAQNFEQNAIYKLLGSDLGTVSGRSINARNKDERIEILFRDISSIYFYCFSTGAILAFLNNKDVFKGKNTGLNPNSTKEVHNSLIQKMDKLKKTQMTAEEFRSFALGNEKNYDKALYEKFFPAQAEAAPKKYLFGLINRKPKPDYRVINIEDYYKIIEENVKDSSVATKLKDLGERMSGLQPELRVAQEEGKAFKLQKILTESQVKDVLIGGEARNPEFMKEILTNIFKTKNNPNALTDKYTFIPQGEIESARSKVLGYVESIIDYSTKAGKKAVKKAKASGSNELVFEGVTMERMQNAVKRNLRTNGLYWGAAMGVSALFLSTVIPKVQYWITKMRTGRDGFPGIENYRKEQQGQKKA